MPVTPIADHPAKFSAPILGQLRVLVRQERDRLRRPPRLLDTFAGVGRIHQLNDIATTTGVELEPEWAACHPDTQVGDATRLPREWSGMYDVIGTSPCYGSRMADHHEPKDGSRRYGYAFQLGRQPSPGSAAVMQWGPEYRSLHTAAIFEWERVLVPSSPGLPDGGLLLLNMKNHYRDDAEQPVVEWWVRTLLERGWWLLAAYPILTPGMGNGANREKRAAAEMVVALRAPSPGRLPL